MLPTLEFYFTLTFEIFIETIVFIDIEEKQNNDYYVYYNVIDTYDSLKC